MFYKVFGGLIVGAALALAFLALKEEGISLFNVSEHTKPVCLQLTPAEQLSKMINDDFQNLAREGQLPKEWSSIATVEINMRSELAKAILGKTRPKIQRVKDGTSYLELEVLDLPDEENPGVILQASLFNIKSKNKIYEIGRTYTMNELNRVTPEKKMPSPSASSLPTATPSSTPTPAKSTRL